MLSQRSLIGRQSVQDVGSDDAARGEDGNGKRN